MGWLLALIAVPAAAVAQDEPRFCPNRPDLGASNCTTELGRVLVEGSALDWSVIEDAATREYTLLAGDVLARFGVGASTEVQVGWTAWGRVRTTDKATGRVETARGVGDVRLAVRQNLSGNAGERLGVALEPFVTAPVGRQPIGADSWGAGLVLPVSYDLGRDWEALFTGEAQVGGETGRGRFGWGTTFGLGRALGERVGAVVEVAASRLDGPTAVVGALSVAWQPRPGLQFDLLGVAGLNRAAADAQVQIGAAILF